MGGWFFPGFMHICVKPYPDQSWLAENRPLTFDGAELHSLILVASQNFLHLSMNSLILSAEMQLKVEQFRERFRAGALSLMALVSIQITSRARIASDFFYSESNTESVLLELYQSVAGAPHSAIRSCRSTCDLFCGEFDSRCFQSVSLSMNLAIPVCCSVLYILVACYLWTH